MIIIDAANLPEAWIRAYQLCTNPHKEQLAPFCVGFDAIDETIWNPAIKDILNKSLSATGDALVETVRNTIFPQSIWQIARGDRSRFFSTYLKMWPKIKRTQQNYRGLYFHRLIAYPNGDIPVNQLEQIISAWNLGTHRKSALQAAIFDPGTDLTFALQQGFPCLQQIVFHPCGSNGSEGLNVVAFYASQHCYRKAFGNYWGLQCLGQFMAKEMGLSLNRVYCFASNFGLGVPKKELTQLSHELAPHFLTE